MVSAFDPPMSISGCRCPLFGELTEFLLDPRAVLEDDRDCWSDVDFYGSQVSLPLHYR